MSHEIKNVICQLTSIFSIYFQLSNWEKLPDDKPVLSAYSRLAGQEWFFADLNKETIHNIITVRNGKAELMTY